VRISRGLGIDRKDLLRVLLTAMERPEECITEDNPAFMRNILTEFDLMESPIPKYFPGDGGHYITSGVISAEFGGKRNLSFHRMMVLDSGRLAVRLVPRHLYSMYNQAMEQGEDLRVAISIGLPPELLLSAAMSVSYDTDESMIASSISFIAKGERVKLARLNSGLYVPAASEYVFEGRLTPELVDEGPFVDITGTYDEVRKQPVIEIDTIYHVDNPIFHLLLPGGNEHFLLMGLPREPVIYRSVQNVVPAVRDVRLTEGGCSWLNGVVSITPQRKGDAKNAILAAFSGHPSMKKVIVVDEDIDIHNDREVEWAVATRSQPDTDMFVITGARGSSLDPSL
jgi:UbiD family decarboxylase